MSIQPLSSAVINQIKSSTAITSLNGIICELLKNSLDAGSSKLAITVDYSRGACTVEDDGMGILPSEFEELGGLGKLYHTSKCSEETTFYGRRGCFLASLSALALVSITSHHHEYRSHSTLTMHRTEIISRQIPAPTQNNLSNLHHGTRVTVRDLFGAMPVRVKQRAIISEKEGGNLRDWEQLIRQLVLLLLSWNMPVSLNLQDSVTKQKLILRPISLSTHLKSALDVSFVSTLLSQAELISPEDKASWLAVSASTFTIGIEGAVSLNPSPTKAVQFISIGINPLSAINGTSILHDEINRLFSNSNFGKKKAQQLDEEEFRHRAGAVKYEGKGFTNRELRGTKGVDRWPKIFIRIRPNNFSKYFSTEGILSHDGRLLSLIMEVLEAMFSAFLTKHHFCPESLPKKEKNGNEQRKVSDAATKNVPSDSNHIAVTSKSAKLLRPCSKFSSISSRADLVGSRIKFPSFRLSSPHLDGPFDSWSRIKQGAVVANRQNDKDTLPSIDEIHCPSSAPSMTQVSSQLSVDRFSVSRSVLGSRTLLFSRDGIRVRRPFGDISLDSCTKIPPHLSQTTLHTEMDSNFTTWINPITNGRSLTNTRTGHTVPDLPSKSYLMEAKVTFSDPQTRRLTSREPLIDPSFQSEGTTCSWLSRILQSWDNPVFKPAELAIPQVCFEGAGDQIRELWHDQHHICSQISIDRAFKESTAGLQGRVTKEALSSAEIISQLDNKFILAKVSCSARLLHRDEDPAGNHTLIIIDQHAADERIRIEGLLESFFQPSTNMGYRVAIASLDKPIVFEVQKEELKMLQLHKAHFDRWGILYDLPDQPTNCSQDGQIESIQTFSRLRVLSLPPSIQERCKQEPRLLIELIRIELWRVHESALKLVPTELQSVGARSWLEFIQNCPRGIIDMLNSRACRSAIMFNDVLSQSQCEILVRRLSESKFPFQCAHGRPSLVPLVDLEQLQHSTVLGRSFEEGEDFARKFKTWKQAN